MRKRNERRSSITAAFERLRVGIAGVLGAAENGVDGVQSRFAREKSAYRIALHGIARVEHRVLERAAELGSAPASEGHERALAEVERELLERYPEHDAQQDQTERPASTTPSEGFRQAYEEALRERESIYAEWTERGPSELAELVRSAAPGPAGQPWQEWLGAVGSAGLTGRPPGLWRIGTATVPDSPHPQPFPVAVPLLDESHLSITSALGTNAAGQAALLRDEAEALVENLLLRVLSYFQPGLVRIHVWDVAQLTGTLPGLYALTREDLLIAHDPTRLDEMLDDLSDHIRRIHNDALQGGHTSLRLLAESGQRSEPWRIAVLFGNGEPLRDDQQQQLQRIARSGLACGIQLIVVDQPLTVNNALESISLQGRRRARSSISGPHADITLDEPLPRDQVTRVCTDIAAAFHARRARLHIFPDLLPEPEQWWTHRSVSGLQAPVGFHEGDLVWVTLGDASPHMLIGGPSGSGKTNFLYGMLGSLAARYSPDELELYLLDFKEGVSFAQFTPGRRDPSWLPHAQLVGVNVNADREFGLALLRFLAAELRRRADAAKRYEVTKLEELRGEDSGGRWPRIVAVIDEFQFLFAERDPVSTEAAALLEDVARRGRSQGIHLVLASQDVSGIEAFWGKPAIFEQFIVRIALPKARRVLDDKVNNAAVELPRWHAVVNHESGVRHGNQRARIPDATAKGTLDWLQDQLWRQRQEGSAEPRLFDGSELPNLSTVDDYRLLAKTSDAAPKALLGQVIDVNGTAAAVRLARSPGRNVAVLGSIPADAASVLGAAALSLARQHKPGQSRFTLAALIDESAGDARTLAATLRNAGHDADLVGLDEISATVASLSTAIDEPSRSDWGPHYLILYAADSAHTVLERKDPQSRVSGLDHVRKILRHGPEHRLHTLGWWRSAQRLKHTLGMGPVDDIGAWVAFDVQGQDLSAFAAGQLVHWSPRTHRGLFFDRSIHSRPEVILPFDLMDTLDSRACGTGGPR